MKLCSACLLGLNCRHDGNGMSGEIGEKIFSTLKFTK
jgi:uncharacterized protein YbbK (DUF523 family)